MVPRLVNFSGKAIDAQGNALSGTVGATFANYKDQYEGSPLWLETQNVQADAKGNYTVQLGVTKPDGRQSDLRNRVLSTPHRYTVHSGVAAKNTLEPPPSKGAGYVE